MSSSAKHRVKSTWTPLSNEDSNNKIFEERRLLVGKWFDKWTNHQRKQVFEDLLDKSKLRQLEFVGGIVKERVPVYHNDFTRVLPRVISLYVFAHLDPRSLCRASQVCWFWHYLTELDEIWMPKCLRLGWYISFSPSPFEHGIWKRHYIENLKSLRYMKPKEPDVEIAASQLEGMSINGSPRYEESPTPSKPTTRSSRKGSANRVKKPPPWKGSDPVPKDIWRYNYLQNEDDVEKVARLRKKGLHGSEADEISQNAKSRVKAGTNKLTSLRVRSKSLPRNTTPSEYADTVISETSGPPTQAVNEHSGLPGRPEWAQTHNGAIVTADRPRPVRPPAVVKNNRSERDLPSSELFPKSPWKIPKTEEEEYDSDY